MNRHLNLVAAGFCLTALTYGLGRFAYGLLLPEIGRDLDLNATAAGWIGGAAFAAYCLGIVFAFGFVARFGERLLAVSASLFATAGLGLVSISQSTSGLGFAIALAGISTGLTSPPLAAAVARCLDDDAEPRANGAINAGTAAGIVLSGMVVLGYPGNWREVYACFAVAGMVVTVWLWFAMPRPGSGPAAEVRSTLPLLRAGVLSLCASAFLAGGASTAIWTFGASILRDEAGFTSGQVVLAWLVLGAAGTIGVGTGLLANRFGVRAVHRVSISFMALGIVGLVGAGHIPTLGFLVMGLFGTSYIVATGTLLLQGIHLYGDRPAFGLGLPFLVFALGQTAGAPLFGAIWDIAGSGAALAAFGAIMGAAAFWSGGSRASRNATQAPILDPSEAG